MRPLPRIVSLALVAVTVTGPLLAQKYESPPKLEPRQVLAEDVVQAEHYRVVGITSDGHMYRFTVETDWGEYRAYGERTLIMRIHEIGALDRLEGLSKSEVFVKGVGEGVLGSLKGFRTIAHDPVGTAKGMPGGVHRFFKRTKHDAKAGYGQAKGLVTDDEADTESDKAGQDSDEGEAKDDKGLTEEVIDQGTAYAKKYFGVNSSRRRWAQKLEVDPYSSNAVLQEAIGDVANVDAAARFAVRLAPLPHIPGANYANKVSTLVWTREPWELVEENTKALLDAGASEERINVFFANVNFSPTLQTALVQGLLDLRPAEQISLALEQTVSAASEDEARFFVQGAKMLHWFHHQESPLAAILEGGDRVFMARSEDVRTVVMLPVDYIFWTEDMAEAISRAADITPDGPRELWVAGDVSKRAAKEMKALGWKVEPNVAAKMKADPVGEAETK